MEENILENSPFDARMEKLPVHGPLRPLNKLQLKEQTVRLQSYYAFLKDADMQQGDIIRKLKKFAQKLPGPIRNMIIRKLM